ncbi:MAG: DNA mismatch repair endonuclease MutL, partial [Clostridia bacterium]|nr:DNA mismatch repair endonuclease MutL [Clostridia bacterium]
MSKINVLSFEIANLIAAGEVVERPSSVIKELIENSIDSGATKIIAEIKRGGVALIRVSDNGCGIAKEDLPIALKRHATSKIKEKDDLASIMTLGFRGEALAAIASVSELTIISKTKEAEVGNMLTAEAGRIVDVSEVGAADGTTVVVENLFYNVPARRKFLKKDSTEAMSTLALVEKVALSRPDISIQFLIDGEEKFKTLGDGNLLNTVYSVLGKDFSEKLIEVLGEANGIKVSGFIGRSDNVRKNRNLMNVFINGRYVKSLTAQAAIEKAYTSYIAPEAFPSCVLFLEMNPALIDVNVHPAKLEVKFSDERAVFETVYYTVKNALESFAYRPDLTFGAKRSEKNALGAFVPVGDTARAEQMSLKENFFKAENLESFKKNFVKEAPRAYDLDKPVSFSTKHKESTSSEAKRETLTPKTSLELLERYSKAEPEIPKAVLQAEKEKSVSAIPEEKLQKAYKYVGEAFNCYVMIEYENELLIIDKHAAHERILFEEIKARYKSDGRIASQNLLLPISVILTPEELAAAREFAEDIKTVGFDFYINETSLDLIAVPEKISASLAEALVVKMLDELSLGRG